jgi:hypothetical protein
MAIDNKAKKRPARATKAKKTASSRSGSKSGDRLERFVDVQERAVKRVSTFADNVAKLTTRGDYKPSTWAREYASLWRNFAKDMADMTRILFEK